MSDLTSEMIRKCLNKLKVESDKHNKHLKFISPISEDMLTDEFIKMLPSGTEITYSEPIKDIESYSIGNHEPYASGLERIRKQIDKEDE